jgi:hypothetical protein
VGHVDDHAGHRYDCKQQESNPFHSVRPSKFSTTLRIFHVLSSYAFTNLTKVWIIATPREASGSASGASMTIFAGGSLALASGITGAGRQMSVAFLATAVIAYDTMAATAKAARVREDDIACMIILLGGKTSLAVGEWFTSGPPI